MALGAAGIVSAFRSYGQKPAASVVGFLRSSSLSDAKHLIAAFRKGLKEAGFVEGQNLRIEYRAANSRPELLHSIIRDLIALPVDVIVANHIAALPAKAATTSVPIVFATGSDPLRDGLVKRLNQPGGNVTGVVFFATDLAAKRLERLREVLPRDSTIGMLANPSSPNTQGELRDVQTAAVAIGQRLLVFDVASAADFESAFASMVNERVAGLLAGTGAFIHSQREHIISLAARHRIPAIYAEREFADAGGLMSLGASITEAYRQAGLYVGRVLRGENPGNLPVIQSSKIEFVLNMRTARALKLTFPASFMLQADDVIE